MCTEVTRTAPIAGSAVVDGEWVSVDRAVVYYDHPQHTPADHALCIDVWAAVGGDRVALELDAASARDLALAILAILDDDEVAPLVRAADLPMPSAPLSTGERRRRLGELGEP